MGWLSEGEQEDFSQQACQEVARVACLVWMLHMKVTPLCVESTTLNDTTTGLATVICLKDLGSI